MLLQAYTTRLRHDLAAWERAGLIEADQRRRIEGTLVHEDPGGRIVFVAALAASLLLVSGMIAFVAANWSGMPPIARLVVLTAADVATLWTAFALARRAAEANGRRALADVAATLSVGVSAASIALIAQTFHLPGDLRGFATTVSLVAGATALLARSGGSAGVAIAAVAVAGWPDLGLFGHGAVASGGPGLQAWGTLAAIAGGMLAGIVPTGAFLFLLLLAAVDVQAGALTLSGKAFPFDIGLTAALAAFVLTCIPILTDLVRMPARLRDRLTMVDGAGAGLLLVALAGAGVYAIVGGRSAGTATLTAAVAGTCLFATAGWVRLRAREVPYDRIILLGAALATAAMPLLGGGRASPWSLWMVVVPTLMVAAAGHVQGRRALFCWALGMAVLGLLGIVWTSGNLILAALHMLGAGALALGAAQMARRFGNLAGRAQA